MKNRHAVASRAESLLPNRFHQPGFGQLLRKSLFMYRYVVQLISGYIKE